MSSIGSIFKKYSGIGKQGLKQALGIAGVATGAPWLSTALSAISGLHDAAASNPLVSLSFGRGLNKLLNPNHNWFDWDSMENQVTQAGLTGAQREANAFSAGEAQKSRDFTTWMAQNKYQMETSSMQEAGVNPAMVYGGGSLVPTAANGAAASSVSPSSAPDALIALLRMPLEMRMLDAQIKNTEAEAAGKEIDNANAQDMYDLNKGLLSANTDKVRQDINESIQRVKNGEADEALSRMNISKVQAERDLILLQSIEQGITNENKQTLYSLQIRQEELRNQMMETENSYLSVKIEKELAHLDAEIANLYANAALAGSAKIGQDAQNVVSQYYSDHTALTYGIEQGTRILGGIASGAIAATGFGKAGSILKSLFGGAKKIGFR